MIAERGANDKKQSRPEQKIIELMTEQYYNYLSLLKLTNNFQKKIAKYQGLDLEKYHSCLAFVGNITEICTDQKHKNYMFPIVNTPINRYLFANQVNPYFRRPISSIKRTLVVRQENYIKSLVLPFNKILSLSKKQKEQYFIFTHLSIYLKEGKELNFALTEHSHIIQLQNQFYKAVLYPLEASLENNYSEINLNLIYPNGMLQRGSTFAINEIKNKINENIITFPVMGQLRKIHRDSYEKPVNAKEKEVILDVIQDTYPNQFMSVGLCRIYVRFDIIDQEQIIQHMQEGSVYVFRISEVDLNKNLQLIFKLNHWKNNLIRVTRFTQSYFNLQEKYQQMKIEQLTTLTYPVIFRNHYKFKIVKTDIKFMNIKVVCEKCERSVLRINEDQYRCRSQCGSIRGDMKLWIIIGCMDQSGYAEVTLQDEQALIFFNLEAEAHRIKDQFLKEESQPGRAITLFYKKVKDNPNEEEFQEGNTYDKNPYLLTILNHCQIAVIEKEIVAYVKPAINEIFYSLEENVKNEFQVSFARSKEYIKKAKIFLNGQFKTFSDRTRLVPHLKALRVYPSTTAI